MNYDTHVPALAQLYGIDPQQALAALHAKFGEDWSGINPNDDAISIIEQYLQQLQAKAPGVQQPQSPQAPQSQTPQATTGVPGITPDTVVQPAPKQPPVTTPSYQAPQAPNSQKFSQFDDVFKKYAGTLAGDTDFMRIVNATVKAESGMNPNAMGDNGHSIGLFQMHDQGAGAGMSAADRADPDKASAVMIPRFVAIYQQGKQQGLTGTDLASYVSRNVERPLGFEDPNGAAARKYVSAYQELGGQLGSAYAGAENDTGGPNSFQWKSQGLNLNGQQVTARPFGTVGIDDMTKGELQRYYPFADGPQENKQAAYNLVTSLGIQPYSNPYQQMYMNSAEDIGKQAYVKNLLDTGNSGDYANVANLTKNALGSGQVSLFNDPHDIIAKLKNIGATNGLGLQGADMQTFYNQNLDKPEAAAKLLMSLVGPSMSLGLQKYLPETMQRNLLQVQQQLPGQSVNPFVALARQMGY